MSGVDRRAKIRDQLRDFYQIDSASPQRGAERVDAERRPSGPPAMDLDSEQFDVQMYTTQLLQKQSLKELVHTDTELLRRIRSLDGELQDLVYKNYAKFISATDTIRQMKENVSDMETKLKALSANVTHIDEVSKDVSGKLQSHRETLEQTLSLNKMLRKVHFLNELPERMRRFERSGKLHVAVRFWVAGDQVLTKHQGVSTFEKTRADCNEIARSIYDGLQRNLMQLSVSTVSAEPDVMSSSRKIIEDMRLMRSTTIFAGTDDMATSESKFYDDILCTMLRSVEDDFNRQVEAHLQKQSEVLKEFRAAAASSQADPRLVVHLFSVKMSELQSMSQQLKMMFSAVAASSDRCLEIMNPSTPPQQRDPAAEILPKTVQSTLAFIVDLCSDACRAFFGCTTFSASTAGGPSGCVSSLWNFTSKAFRVFHAAFRAIATNLRAPQAMEASLQSEFEDKGSLLLRRVKMVLDDSIGTSLAPVPGGRRPSEEALLCVAFSAKTAAKQLTGDIATMVNVGDVDVVRTSFVDVATRAAGAFVTHCGLRLALLFQRDLDGHFGRHTSESRDTPTAPSQAVITYLNALNTQRVVVTAWLPVDAKHSRVGSAMSHNSGSEAASRVLSSKGTLSSAAAAKASIPVVNFQRRVHQAFSDVDREQAKAMRIFATTPTSVDAPHVLEGVVAFVGKALVERVRSQPSFTNSSFQQLQLDATLFLAMIRFFRELSSIRKESMIQAMWTEAITVVYERIPPAGNRSALPHAVVEKLIAAALTELMQNFAPAATTPAQESVIAPTGNLPIVAAAA